MCVCVYTYIYIYHIYIYHIYKRIRTYCKARSLAYKGLEESKALRSGWISKEKNICIHMYIYINICIHMYIYISELTAKQEALLKELEESKASQSGWTSKESELRKELSDANAIVVEREIQLTKTKADREYICMPLCVCMYTKNVMSVLLSLREGYSLLKPRLIVRGTYVYININEDNMCLGIRYTYTNICIHACK